MKRKQLAIYSSGFNGGIMRKNIYQATQNDFLKATRNCVEDKNLDVSVEVNFFGCVYVVYQLWTSVKYIIHSCNDRMIVSMKTFGINKDAYLSPLFENFKKVSDMLEAYIYYFPRTFEYEINDDEIQLPPDTSEEQEIFHRIHDIVEMMNK